ncbi:extracellular solute-binding protein [Tessaracoccus sp. MC1865]|uniref:ABC transporter substrate-binding protein n=1 Tax=Tessaracoccus sp. MC1865 TaxID=2760310 RepID=UPI001600CEAD|nr:extracellular solute-binding protein [Tessaracoccus sp. MC1865]MBB1483297.1 extracellular solute-binding protein [Tessaracoccus sp. MC1865]QTO37291.1 extracellular solute-binding protein [Tessaracoccus sp. MC1865]
MLKKIVSAAAVAALLLTGCGAGGTSDPEPAEATNGGAGASGEGGSLTLWHYEGANSAMGIAWDEAIKIFEEETGATVNFEEKSFEQIRSTASQVLNSDEAPDVMEFNKGNATAGLLASQGLLADISGAVDEYGWDDKLAPALQTTARYNENGVMGSGPWYGIPNYGEFVTVYYNKAMFEESGLEVPTTYADFIAVMDAFVAEGVTPLATAGLEYPLGQLWYQLALSQADRQWVNDYQLYENPLDWNGKPITYATDTLLEYVDKGYISEDVSGIKAEDAGLAFMGGQSPMFVSGSWWYGRFVDEIEGFEFGLFPFPGSELSLGSSGNLWVVPENAENKELAYEFIDITMRPEIQAILGNNGGLPVAADEADITDEKSLELIQAFNAVNEQDGLSFYPDWATPTFYDVIVAQLQELVNGTKSPAEVREGLAAEYNSYAEEVS